MAVVVGRVLSPRFPNPDHQVKGVRTKVLEVGVHAPHFSSKTVVRLQRERLPQVVVVRLLR